MKIMNEKQNKVKRARPRKKIDTFSVVRGNPKGEKVFQLPTRITTPESYGEIDEGEKLIVSPYSEFIPLTYMTLYGDRRTFSEGSPKGKTNAKRTVEIMYNALRKDHIFGIASRINRTSLSNNMTYETLFSRFSTSCGSFSIHRENGSSWIICTPLGVYIVRGELGDDWRRKPLIPLILPAVHKSNYMYQRLFMLKHKGVVDTSKTCVFVNKDLEDPSFTPLSMRREYLNTFEREFLKYQWNIWKVPASFIMDNCFLPISIYPDNTSIFQVKEEKTKILKEFYQRLQRNSDVIVSDLSLVEEDDDEAEGDSDDDILVGEEMEGEEELAEEEGRRIEF